MTASRNEQSNTLVQAPKAPIISQSEVAELVDALDLGSSGAIRGGSSPPFRICLE